MDVEGNLVEGFEKVEQVMVQFYGSLLGKQHNSRTKIDLQVMEQRPVLTLEQQLTTCKDINDPEIKETIFSIPNSKFPGPDGFSSGLYKAT